MSVHIQFKVLQSDFLKSLQSTYSKCSKISNTFLFLFSKLSDKMLVFGVRIHKMLVRTANREDPDQTASPEAV